MPKTILSLVLLAGYFFGTAAEAASSAIAVQAVAAYGAAAAGNNANANILVVVTNPNSGEGVTNLNKDDFTVIDHFSLPGQACGFSNRITGFDNIGTGAYHITVSNHSDSPPPGGCKWVRGDYLGQILVRSGSGMGQAVFLLSVF